MSSEAPVPFPSTFTPHGDAMTSPERFSELVRAHHRELLVYAVALTKNSATARDIVQEAFITAYRKSGAFDETRDFATWMRGIVRNKWREWLRKNRRYDLGDHELARLDEDITSWQSRRADGGSNLFAELDDCLCQLPPLLQEAVQAYYYEGRSGDEVAAHLGVAPAAIRKRLERARILLKQCLDRKKSNPTSPPES